MATLFLTCGLPAAGKTTWAKSLEKEEKAIRLTADDWLTTLYPGVQRPEIDEHRQRVEQLQWATARRALRVGANVVLDWGLWSRDERDRFRREAKDELGARVVLCLLDPPLDQLKERVQARPEDSPWHIEPAELDAWERLFERPDGDEILAYDDVKRRDRL